jgi:Flp pilus assembly protein TadB
MRYLSLFSFAAALVLLASCHSSDVALRHSRIRTCISEELHTQALQKEITEVQPTATITAVAEASTLIQTTEILPVSAATKKQLLPSHGKSISVKQQTNQTKNTAKQHTAARPTANHKMPKHAGFFSNIGYSFGVVGLVFIIVGLVLLLIGGLIIDTLAALAIAFGFVFILIWLVLAILQGLFDVIL